MIFQKEVYKNLLALFLGIILSFGTAELLLQIYNPFEFRIKGDKIILPVNKEYIFKNHINQNDTSSKLDHSIVHRKNSLGFRGRELPKDLGQYLSIITVGGSTTECFYLSEGKTWTDILGNKLSKKFKNVWINNAGFDGQSTFGHIVLMEDYICKIKPKIVLFLTGANDIQISSAKSRDKSFVRDGIQFSSPRDFIISCANYSEVVSVAINLYRFILAKTRGLGHENLDFKTVIDSLKDEEAIKQEDLNYLKQKHYLEGYKSRIRKLIYISRKNQIEPVFLTQPSLYGDFIDEDTSIDFSVTKTNHEMIELYNDALREVATKEQIFLIDLSEKMLKSSKYYYDFFHFTNQGAEKVGEIIFYDITTFIRDTFPITRSKSSE